MESGFLIWEATESSILPSEVPWGVVFRAVGLGGCFLTVGIVPCRFNSAQRSNMPAKKDTALPSTTGQGGKGGRIAVSSGRPYQEKPTELLNEQEFCDSFCLPNGVSIQLEKGDPMPTEKVGHNAIYFSKEQFNTRLCFSLRSFFNQFLHYTQITPVYIHPNIVLVLIGCSILNMLFHLDLSLLEVIFIYTIKNGKNDIFSMFALISSLQLVMSLLDSNKGGAKGHVLVKGLWAGLMEHPKRDFCLNCSLKIPGRDGFERPFPINISC